MKYDAKFFAGNRPASLSSARAILPIVLDFVRPKSVVDLGCGTGAWLSVFQELGIRDVLGVDGSYIEPSSLLIPKERFRSHDLTESLRLEGDFDLALSVEVAEHIPSSSAATFVESLTRLSKVVLFSAASPMQGERGHSNEQWLDYWIGLFDSRRYLPVDCLRWRIWDHPEVAPWYAQNLLFFVAKDRLGEYPQLEFARARQVSGVPSVIHPRLFLRAVDPARLSVRQGMEKMLSILRAKVMRHPPIAFPSKKAQ